MRNLVEEGNYCEINNNKRNWAYMEELNQESCLIFYEALKTLLQFPAVVLARVNCKCAYK